MRPVGRNLHASAGAFPCFCKCLQRSTLGRKQAHVHPPSFDVITMPADGATAKPSLPRKSPDGGERREHPAMPARETRYIMGGENLGPGRVGLIDPLR